tara:strand:+ start:270 stop:572 length:303 start_codon:yes stop_codon:yes gene_type:complete
MGDEQQLSFDLSNCKIIDTSYTNDTGGEYTFNVSGKNRYSEAGLAPNLSWDYGDKIDPDRVEKMCKEYPALKKSWENFHAIYKMVDQDYKGNYEGDNVSF